MGKPLRVLIVEDSEDDALLLIFELRAATTPLSPKGSKPSRRCGRHSRSKPGMWSSSDYVLPGFSGLEALRLCAEAPRPPLHRVSGKIGEDTACRP